MGVPIGMRPLNGIGELINKTHLKGGAYSKESAYWKEGAKSNHYGTGTVTFKNVTVPVVIGTFRIWLLP